MATSTTPSSFAALPGVRLQARTSSNGSTARIASRCERPWVPEPRIASVRLSGRASSRVATAVTAAVRMAVIAPALTSARVSPVSPSKSATNPWWLSSPRAAFPGAMQTVLSAYTEPSPPR